MSSRTLLSLLSVHITFGYSNSLGIVARLLWSHGPLSLGNGYEEGQSYWFTVGMKASECGRCNLL